MAQTKKITVELGFKSNTEQVKKNINDLAANLKEISNVEIGLKGSSLDDAKKAAKELGLELQKAVNVDTGRLDLNKLTSNLAKGKKDIVSLSTELLKAGPIGQKSFLQIAQAMSQAEVPMIKINQGLKEFMDNLGKTAKWQIAQTAIQTVQGSLQNAVREAEQLNKALNDIRIVTGLDKTAMAQFAKEANKVAKELKTTTKDYAEASLIFYQQGLNAAEAAKRAKTVIKMSQVTGDSAQAVSDQMTAIWNNFADGTKTLEYYADAMAKLGAETAASTSEIANGLEKFAAIAETVGLSYETAMASVATVIDKTRQSADVVGTAFKTIFARVQGLSLDGVTDDGVSLNKYSQALEKVGVDVLTASGELRDMDEILNDLGSKWEGLGKETQVAVAQVVGGARQYNQILSLMDNWADVQNNINKATSSTGELTKQADIWADSYEAASKRVEEAKARASENFLNSEDVVNLTNAFADLITWVDKFIDSFGGITPLALTIAGIFSHKLIPIFKTGFTGLMNNLKVFGGNVFGTSEKLIKDTQDQFNNFLESYKNGDIEDSLKAQVEWNQKLIKVKQEMANITQYMSEQEKEKALSLLSTYEDSVQTAIRAQEAYQEAASKQKEAIHGFTEQKMKTAVTEQFFKDQGIQGESKQDRIISLSREDLKEKSESIENQEGILRNKLLTINESIKKKEEDRKKNQDALIEAYDLEDWYIEEGVSVRNQERSSNRKKITELEFESSDIEQSIQESKEEYSKLLKELEQAEEKNKVIKQDLELARKLQTIRQSTGTEEGRQTASFGNTYLNISEDVTLNEEQRKLYDTKFSQVEQEKITLRGKEVGLELEFKKEIVDGQEVESKYVKNSIQNYEILAQKVIDYKLELAEIQQINEEIYSSLGEEGQEYSKALDERNMANITELRAQQAHDKALEDKERAQINLNEAYNIAEASLSSDGVAYTEEQKAEHQQALKLAQEEYVNAIAKTKETQAQLDKATENSAKAQNRFAKAEQGVKKVSQDTLKVLNKNKEQLKEIAKRAGLSEEAFEDFSNALEDIDNVDSFKKIQGYLKNFEVTTGETVNSVRVLSETVRDALELNISPEEVQRLAQTYKIAEEEALKLAIAEKKAQEDSEEIQKKLDGFGNKIESVASTVSSASAAFAGLYAGVNQIFDVFEEGATPLERFLSILGAVVSIAPFFVTATKLIASAYSFATKTQEKENAKQEKSDIKQTETKIFTELIKGIAERNPKAIAAAVTAGALLATIGGVVIGGAISKNKGEKQQERNDKTIEQAQKTNEVAQATLKESNALNDLTSQYHKMNQAGLDTVEVKKDILDQINKNIEGYQNYQKEIGLTGEKAEQLTKIIEELKQAQNALFTATNDTAVENVKTISELSREADALIAEDAKQDAISAQNAILSNVGLTAKNTSGERTGTAGMIIRKVGGVDSSADEEKQAWDIIDKYLKDSGQSERRRRNNRETGLVKIRTTSSQIFIEDFERLQNAAQEMMNSPIPEVSNPAINDTLREINDLLENHRTHYEQLKQQQAVIDQYNIVGSANSLSKVQGVTNKIEEVNSFDEYSAYLSNLKTQYRIENGSMNEEQEKAIEDYVNSQEGMSIYATAQQRIKTLDFEDNADFQNFIKSLNDEKLKLFTEVDINTFKNQEDIETEINRLQNVADRKEIQIKIGNINSILSTLKSEGMTQEDWDKIAENELFINDPAAFNDFLSKTYNNQVLDLGKALDIETNKKISSLTREKNFVEEKALGDGSNLSEEAKKEYKKRLTELENELIIQKKIRDEQLKYVNSLVKSDVVDIYKKHNKELEVLQKGYSKLSQILKDTFGQDQIKTQEEMITNLKEQKRVLESMSPLDEQEIDLAKTKVNNKLKELGFNPEDLEFNGDNTVDVLNFLYEELEGAGSAAEEYQKNVYEPIKELLDNYDSKVSTKTSREEEIRNKEREIKSANYEKLTTQLELKLELDQDTMLEVDYNFKKLSKTIKGMSESVNLFSDKIKSVSDGFSAYDTFVNNLHQDMLEGNITEAEYVKGLREAREESYKQLEAMESLKEEIINFYGEHLQKASEEIDKYSDRVDHATSVLTQYKTILELTGKSQSNQMKSVLQGAATVAENSLNISQKEFLMFKQQATDAKAALDKYVEAAGNSLDKEDAKYQLLEKRWLDATEKAEESQQNMLEKTQAWGEAMRASVQYNMEEITKELEKAFLSDKYSDFDSLLTAMERRSTLQEDYLTKTNQIYETTKMIRTAQQELDKASNAATKQQLKQFIEKTNQLKSQEKLSNVELDIQQKRYNLLLAEIALKDAQDAKSTVRLTRTADGGFGYVYTADENQVNEAQQNYDDAENELYNTQLNAANTYGQKRFQAQQELIQELQALNAQYLNGEISSIEEYQSKSTALIDFYNQKIANSNDIYEKSLEGSLSVASDTLVKDFDFINYTSEQWASVMKTYTDQIQGELSTWQNTISTIEKMAAIDSESIAETMGEITSSTSELTEELAKDGGLIDSLETFLEKGKGITDENFANWYKTLDNLTEKYSDLTEQILKAVKAQAGLSNDDETYSVVRNIAKGILKGEDVTPLMEMLEVMDNDLAQNLKTLSEYSNYSNGYNLLKSLSENQQNSYTLSKLGQTVKGIKTNPGEIISTTTKPEEGQGNSNVIEGEQDNSNVPEEKPENGTLYTTETTNEQYANILLSSLKAGKQTSDGLIFEKAAEFLAGNGVNRDQAKIFLHALNSSGFDANEKQAYLNAIGGKGSITSELISRIKGNLVSDSQAALEYLPGIDKNEAVEWQNGITGIQQAPDTIGDLRLDLKNRWLELDNDWVKLMKINWLGYREPLQKISLDNFYGTYLPGFKTGGYTGSWGPEGKMAMLHEKEIVLNKEDTVNLLDSIKLLRSILTTIDLQAANAQFSSLLPSSFYTPTSSGDTLEQNVHIEASFPNVSDRNEIEEAFNTLVNRASQYANRKK